MAGHSASVHGKYMVVFGGFQRPGNVVHCVKSNDIWKLDLELWEWHKQETTGMFSSYLVYPYISLLLLGPKPVGRYGHTQTALDDKRFLIIGGTGGTTAYLSDVWLLTMSHDLWQWTSVEIKNSSEAPSNLWCNPVCKVIHCICFSHRCCSHIVLGFLI